MFLKKLPESLRNGVVTLLFKKGARTDLGNWRPITLLIFRPEIVLEDFNDENELCFRGPDTPGSGLCSVGEVDHRLLSLGERRHLSCERQTE